MVDKFIIDANLRQTLINYIAVGSISKGLTWAELQIILESLQNLPPVETPKPKLVQEEKQ